MNSPFQPTEMSGTPIGFGVGAGPQCWSRSLGSVFYTANFYSSTVTGQRSTKTPAPSPHSLRRRGASQLCADRPAHLVPGGWAHKLDRRLIKDVPGAEAGFCPRITIDSQFFKNAAEFLARCFYGAHGFDSKPDFWGLASRPLTKDAHEV